MGCCGHGHGTSTCGDALLSPGVEPWHREMRHYTGRLLTRDTPFSSRMQHLLHQHKAQVANPQYTCECRHMQCNSPYARRMHQQASMATAAAAIRLPVPPCLGGNLTRISSPLRFILLRLACNMYSYVPTGASQQTCREQVNVFISSSLLVE